MSSAFTKSGVPGMTGPSSPSNVTCFAPAFTPALSSTAFSGTPRQSALPIAPLASCPPATRGSKKPRLLPEHWLTAAYSIAGIALRSASESDSGFSTEPFTTMR